MLDSGDRDLAAVEHDANGHAEALRRDGEVVLEIATHIVRPPDGTAPHYAATLLLTGDGPPGLPSGAGTAPHERTGPAGPHAVCVPGLCAAHQARTSGRLLCFAGRERVTGDHTVAELLEVTAVERVLRIGGAVAGAAEVVRTSGFVRPTLRGGGTILQTRPGSAGTLHPAEIAYPHRCCSSH